MSKRLLLCSKVILNQLAEFEAGFPDQTRSVMLRRTILLALRGVSASLVSMKAKKAG
jgi:hypothetical protein